MKKHLVEKLEKAINDYNAVQRDEEQRIDLNESLKEISDIEDENEILEIIETIEETKDYLEKTIEEENYLKNLTGIYYKFICLNGYLQDKLFTKEELGNEKRMKEIATNYEAILVRYKYKNGEILDMKELYKPIWF